MLVTEWVRWKVQLRQRFPKTNLLAQRIQKQFNTAKFAPKVQFKADLNPDSTINFVALATDNHED